MPGWHARTKGLVEQGKLRVAGITEEQHGDRTALFMQWHQMDWPVMLDSLNLLDVSAVPITLLIDEHGVIRFRNPQPEELTIFLDAVYEPPSAPRPALAIDEGGPAHAVLWGSDSDLTRAIGQWEALIESDPQEGRVPFRLGVAYRKRFDSPERLPGDFGRAIASWSQALAINPNQYIWRRRIQQYGPRLDKPYSFYDWIHEAREAITARGESPHQLTAEPSGTEFAHPDEGAAPQATTEHPDPDGKVTQDQELVRVEATAVASTRDNQPAYRVHLRFSPSSPLKAHWNNEAGELKVHVDAKDVRVVDLRQTTATPRTATSSEERMLEFELHPAAEAAFPASVDIAAFYFVCEGAEGTCLFRRQDLRVPLP